MSTAIIAADAETVDAVAAARPQSAFARFTHAIIRNRKATAGIVILLILVIVAIFPGVFARDDPQAAVYGQNLGPSAQHLLGYNSARPGRLLPGDLGHTPDTDRHGGRECARHVHLDGDRVTAAYVGGLTDRSLSLLTDIFLIIPTLPLLIVLASYLPPGSVTMIVVLTATSWAFQARQLRSQGILASCP